MCLIYWQIGNSGFLDFCDPLVVNLILGCCLIREIKFFRIRENRLKWLSWREKVFQKVVYEQGSFM